MEEDEQDEEPPEAIVATSQEAGDDERHDEMRHVDDELRISTRARCPACSACCNVTVGTVPPKSHSSMRIWGERMRHQPEPAEPRSMSYSVSST